MSRIVSARRSLAAVTACLVALAGCTTPSEPVAAAPAIAEPAAAAEPATEESADAAAAARPASAADDAAPRGESIRLADGDEPIVRVVRRVVSDGVYRTERTIHADGASVQRVEALDPPGEPFVERRELGRRFVLRLLRDLDGAGLFALDPARLAEPDGPSGANDSGATTTLEIRLPSGVLRWTVHRLEARLADASRPAPDLAIVARSLALIDGLLPERAP